ncbi:MAG: hypothetical protein JOZ31_08940 [Verrucomicrobia bacterium]|nr:hypothetical protein [Verrucomicrobiota bacterium]MBV8484823.1 hypothetical protein [Verrucomicrobiota bacterium]
MNRNSCFCLLLIIALVGKASAATQYDDTVKALMERYQQVEAQLDRSVRYSRKTETQGNTTVERAWYNGADDPIKVAVERVSSAGRELTEYFSLDFDDAGAMFVLTRKETAQPDGGTQVDESRQYFGNDGKLLRELRKSGSFKPGEALDTVRFPNTTVDLSKRPKDDRPEEQRAVAEYDFLSEPEKIASALRQAGPPEFDPFAGVTGDSAKYRVIHNTASPDGRYAVALGFTAKDIDWEGFKDPDFPGTYSANGWQPDDQAPDPDYGRIVNYIVDLTTRQILGITNGDYFGTKQRYNHDQCSVTWSPDSKTFVEVTSWKWGYNRCTAAKISSAGKLLDPVDLGKYAEKAAQGHLGTHKGPKYNGSIDISVDTVTAGDVVNLTILGQGTSGDHKGDVYFSLDEFIRVRETPSGLRLETVNIHTSPEN